MRLTGKTALVTGAGGGLGGAIAKRFAVEGASMLCTDRDLPRAEATAAAIAEADGTASAFRADIAEAGDCEAQVAETVQRYGRIDIAVNNAGVGLHRLALETSLDDWEWVLSVNLWGVIHGCHHFTPQMAERGRGHVVNISSMLGYFGQPGAIGYVTSKFAVLGLSESLRGELAERDVGVSTICPGIIRTNIIRDTRFSEANRESQRDDIEEAYARRDYGPDKVAKAVLSAIRRNRAVVPVTPESWALYGLKRALPGVTEPVGRWLQRRFR